MAHIKRKCNNIINYERKLKKVEEGNQGEETISKSDKKDSGNRAEKILVYLGIGGGIITLVGAIFAIICNIIIPISTHSNEIGKLRDDIEDLDDDISDLSDNLDDLVKYVYSNKNTFGSAEANDESDAISVVFIDGYAPEVKSGNDECIIQEPNWKKDGTEIIAINFNDDEIDYRPDELQNRPFVTMYTDGGNEIYFYGQCNEENHWDGNCILNIYRDNELITIFDGIYNNGDLYSYKRISCESGKKWTVVDRIVEKDYTRGETSVFTKTQSFSKQIDSERLDKSQIVTIEDFEKKLDKEPMKQYYNGNTSNGFYNDDSGKAYLVNYDENGNVDYLYVGKISKGQAEDLTGDAWSISLGGDGYYYYKGEYSNGRHDIPKNWNSMSQEDINEKVNPDKFNCPLFGLIGENL